MAGGEKELLFINGYGGNLEQPGIKWLMNRFKEGDFTVTHVRLPTVIRNFGEDILDPVTEVRSELPDHVIAGFSLGALTATYLKGSLGKVYLSPFWGINDRWDFRGLGGILRIMAGFNKPTLKRQFEKEDAGPLARNEDMRGIPEYVDPRTINEMRNAQKSMPEPGQDDVVFYCSDDKVISIKAIENRNLEKHRFGGGHMFYLSRERNEILSGIIQTLDRFFISTQPVDKLR